MPKYAKHIALLAAFAMLCGCTGNTGSTQTSTAEAVQTAQGSAEAPHSSEAPPAGETTADVSSQPGQPEQTEQPVQTGNSSGVSLISGGDSKYSDIFELNGTWCDVSELPFNVETYDVPLLGKWGGDNFLGCFDKKMYFTEGPRSTASGGLKTGCGDSTRSPERKSCCTTTAATIPGCPRCLQTTLTSYTKGLPSNSTRTAP